MISELVVSLTLTLVLELIVARILGIKDKYDILTVVFANICTNPALVYICIFAELFVSLTTVYAIAGVLEIFAVVVEYLIYRRIFKYKKISPFLVSLLCNVFSFTTGILLERILNI